MPSFPPTLLLIALLVSVQCGSNANELGERPIPMDFNPTSTYQKPSPPARDCIRTIQTINELSVDPNNIGNGRQCIGCVPVQKSCPPDPDCQALIDTMYVNCADNRGSETAHEDGVTLPDGYFYDPQRTIGGTWDLETKEQLRIAIGRCGCSSVGRLSLSGVSVGVGVASFLYFFMQLV
ncbi:hypothetical protein TL16_g08338 [Triparma laevis f. inornata]|uniref:Uncharacterized protein n=2 Tax=Triparma laevis TaxID=1534972 RepID=A0A9W7CB51_9STRA|nr:hypothetical protein TL16_g08338 [Triparma laevis f. inornata]GMI06515.1 hypothetical protein TrLO_g11820 [Triparma laevis f. longispina]